jgi:two-component system sensor histidine kinase KdpD
VQESWSRYAWALAACVVTTLLTLPMLAMFDLANIVMLFLLCVVLVAVKLGRGPAMLSAVLSVAAFDYFFVPPRFSFAVTDVQYLVTFAVMLGVGMLIGQLTANLRFAASVSASRERRAHALFALTRDLSAALQTVQVVELGEAAVKRTFGGQARVLITNANDQLELGSNLTDGLDASIADWCFHHGQRAGLATATLPSSRWHYVPLQAPMRIRGVLALQPEQARWLLIPEQVQQLETLARQIAIALERVHYVDVAQSAVVQMESERLRNTLLAAMSHDVRTPLTALIGQAETLEQLGPLSDEQRATVQSMGHEARELSALVGNLLDMARLESGQVQLRRDWQSVEEVVGGAIRAARHSLGTLEVQTDLPRDLPLVEMDAVLMERVLVNLLENAAKYGVTSGLVQHPAIRVSARTTAHTLELTVRDFGPGLPAASRGQEHTLFDKFTRGKTESSTRGVGLGLAICKAVVEAHRGKISAAPASGGGAEFSISLPRLAPPQALEAEDA